MPYQPTYRKDHHALDCDCEACLTEYGDHFEAVLLIDRLAAHDPERTGAVPATDAEWTSYLDSEFPRVKTREKTVNGHILRTRGDGHKCPDYSKCPTCDWDLGVCRNCGAAEIELDEPCKAQDAEFPRDATHPPLR